MKIRLSIPLSVLIILTAVPCQGAAWCQSIAGQCAALGRQLTNALGLGDTRVVASILKDMPAEMRLEIAQHLDSSSLMRLAEMDPNYYKIIKTMRSFQDLQKLMWRHYGNLQAALGDALQNNNLWPISYLIRRLDSNPATARMSAKAIIEEIKYGDKNIVAELLKRGANPNAFDEYHTLLTAAASNGHDEIVQMLLAHGANIDADNGKGWTALANAADYYRATTVDLLIAAGANIDKALDELRSDNLHNDQHAINAIKFLEERARLSPLLNAIKFNQKEIVAEILLSGVNPNAVDSAITPLREAAGRGLDDLVQLLLDHGANVDGFAANTGKPTPLAQAARGNHTTTVDLLIAAGADVAQALRELYYTKSSPAAIQLLEQHSAIAQVPR